jgi:hypothetical protein
MKMLRTCHPSGLCEKRTYLPFHSNWRCKKLSDRASAKNDHFGHGHDLPTGSVKTTSRYFIFCSMRSCEVTSWVPFGGSKDILNPLRIRLGVLNDETEYGAILVWGRWTAWLAEEIITCHCVANRHSPSRFGRIVLFDPNHPATAAELVTCKVAYYSMQK